MTEIDNFLSRAEGTAAPPVNLVVSIAFNPNVESGWFTGIMGIINSVTMLAIILAGAALVRVTPFEIVMSKKSKIWANGLVIVVAVALSLYFIVRGLLHIPIAGSIPLFLLGVVLYLFFATTVGLLLGTIARSMPQLGLLYLLVYGDAVRQQQAILYRGAGFSVVRRQFALTGAIAVLVLLLALLRFRDIAPVDLECRRKQRIRQRCPFVILASCSIPDR